MATYWLGFCYYKGYGVPKDIAKANSLLGTNFSEATSEGTTTKNTDAVKTVVTSSEVNTSSETTNTNIFASTKDISGIWSGQLLFFDWSGKHIEQKIPVTLTLQKDEETAQLRVIWNIERQEVSNDYVHIENTLYYDDFKLNLPYQSLNKKLPTQVTHDITSVDFALKTVDTTTYLVGTIESFISDWQESSMPCKLVLQQKESFENSNEELSDEALTALANQKDKFIKLYPNPFVEDLIISYALENEATTEVSIAQLNGQGRKVIKASGPQKADTYHYTIHGTSFKKGMYIVTILVNGERKTRIIVKK